MPTIPQITDSVAPADLVGVLNELINAINGGVNGILSSDPVATASAASAPEQNLKTYSLPPDALAQQGDGLRITAWGITAANTNSKVVTLYFGAATVATFTTIVSGQSWTITGLITRGATALLQAISGLAVAGVAASPNNVAGTVNLAAAVLIRLACTDGAAVAASITCNGLLVERIE
jgi:hypothetical protein